MFLEKLNAISVCRLPSFFAFCLVACGGGTSATEGESEAEAEAEAEAESEAEAECAPQSCDDGVECTDDSWNEESCGCSHIQLHARCPQGQICDLENGCVSPPPCGSVSDCPDPGDPCVVIECESSTATCTYDPLDSDGDGHAPQVCVSVGGDDCDDSSPCDPDKDKDCDWEDSNGGSLTYPGAEEICDEKDNDCNGVIDDLPEIGLPCDGDDGDECEEGVWECWYGERRGLGCSDNTSANREICNGEDDDCDGVVDNTDLEEICNGEDDDCDGSVDEDWSDLGTTCAAFDICGEWGTGNYVCDSSGDGAVCEAGATDPSECCGDGFCQVSIAEDEETCPEDCEGFSGDGICSEPDDEDDFWSMEFCYESPDDCVEHCGNGSCSRIFTCARFVDNLSEMIACMGDGSADSQSLFADLYVCWEAQCSGECIRAGGVGCRACSCASCYSLTNVCGADICSGG